MTDGYREFAAASCPKETVVAAPGAYNAGELPGVEPNPDVPSGAEIENPVDISLSEFIPVLPPLSRYENFSTTVYTFGIEVHNENGAAAYDESFYLMRNGNRLSAAYYSEDMTIAGVNHTEISQLVLRVSAGCSVTICPYLYNADMSGYYVATMLERSFVAGQSPAFYGYAAYPYEMWEQLQAFMAQDYGNIQYDRAVVDLIKADGSAATYGLDYYAEFDGIRLQNEADYDSILSYYDTKICESMDYETALRRLAIKSLEPLTARCMPCHGNGYYPSIYRDVAFREEPQIIEPFTAALYVWDNRVEILSTQPQANALLIKAHYNGTKLISVEKKIISVAKGHSSISFGTITDNTVFMLLTGNLKPLAAKIG